MKSNVYFVTAHSITLRLGFNTRAYITGLALYRSCSSSWRRTVSRREAERTEISSRVMARGPLPLVAAGSPEATASRSLTSGRLFFRCRTPLSSPCSAQHSGLRVCIMGNLCRNVENSDGLKNHFSH